MIDNPNCNVWRQVKSATSRVGGQRISSGQHAACFIRCCLLSSVLLLVHPAGVIAAQTEAAELKAWEQHALTHPGNVQRGRALFHSQKTKCATCHHVSPPTAKKRSADGHAAIAGPDLSAIGGKFDRPHLIESILEPSRQIVEGYRTHILVLDDGTTINGVIKRESGTQVDIVNADGKRRTILPLDLEVLRNESDFGRESSVTTRPLRTRNLSD